MADVFKVEVCVATAHGIEQIDLQVAPNCTVRQALIAAGLLHRYALDLDHVCVGIYGKLKPLDTIVQPSDRIEIYRPLTVDPNAARLRRHKKKKTESQQRAKSNSSPL